MKRKCVLPSFNLCTSIHAQKCFFDKIFYFTLFLGSLLLGNNKIFADDNLDVEWVRNYGGSGEDRFQSSIVTKTNAIIGVGYFDSTDGSLKNKGAQDAFIIKCDSNGNKIWSQRFGGSSDDKFRAVVQTSDNGYVVVGHSSSTDAGYSNKGREDGVIIKYDDDGNQVWINSFGGSEIDIFRSVVETSDKGFLVAGYSHSVDAGFNNKGYYDGLIIKYDENGKELWVKNWGGANYDIFKKVIETSDKYMVVVGEVMSRDISGLSGLSSEGYYDAVIVKFDLSGNQIWVRNFGGTDNDYFESIIETSSKDYIVVGYSYSSNSYTANSGGTDGIIIKYDTSGNIQWAGSIGGSSAEYLGSIVETNDGNFLVCGYSWSSNSDFVSKGTQDGIVAKYNNSGKRIWIKNFGDILQDTFVGVSENSLGEIILTGSTASNIGFINKGSYDAIIVKYSEVVDISSETESKNSVVHIMPNNNLTMTLSTNSIKFENYDGIEDLELKKVLDITVESTLPYDIVVYMETEIQNQEKTRTLNHSILQIKPNNKNDYSSFNAIGEGLILFENQPVTSSTIHSVDMKLKKTSGFIVDIYKTSLKFEVSQL